jgi:hypothetical protein
MYFFVRYIVERGDGNKERESYALIYDSFSLFNLLDRIEEGSRL